MQPADREYVSGPVHAELLSHLLVDVGFVAENRAFDECPDIPIVEQVEKTFPRHIEHPPVPSIQRDLIIQHIESSCGEQIPDAAAPQIYPVIETPRIVGRRRFP